MKPQNPSHPNFNLALYHFIGTVNGVDIFNVRKTPHHYIAVRDAPFVGAYVFHELYSTEYKIESGPNYGPISDPEIINFCIAHHNLLS